MPPSLDVVAPAGWRGLDGVVRRALGRALDGHAIDPPAALALIHTDDPADVSALLAVAGTVRSHLKGTLVTYSPKVFLPITNLCRDRCGYCTFRSDPDDPHAWTMLPEDVRAASRAGHRSGCIEALMCLGDKPELAFRTYRDTLAVLGHRTTIEYVRQACAIALDEGLLPHTNAGVLSRDELCLLRPVNVSMGLMLESVSPRLRGKGQVHYHAPDKDPQRRLQTLRDAGELQIPFTTGILVGIGDTRTERVASLEAIRALHAEHGHIQEVIVQNFRAKPTTAAATRPEPGSLELAQTLAVARLLLWDMNIQAPPNLSPYDHRLLLTAGLNDWGGISPLTPDYVNPEAPWPHVAALADLCRSEGFTLQPRLPVYAEYLHQPGFLDPTLAAPVAARAAERGVSLC